MEKGYLVLETGHVFEGIRIGNKQETLGEVVFNTSMTGYQEIITDPSYAGQILVFCYPLIGNYGINDCDDESAKPQVAGVIVGESCETPSHYLSTLSFHDQLEQARVAGLTGVDTRALVKLIRQYGTVKGIITDTVQHTDRGEVSVAAYQESMNSLDQVFWVDKVSTPHVQTFDGNGAHVVLMDFGYKKSILQALLHEGCRVSVVPYHFTYEQIQALQPDGVLFSNGPGDPMRLEPWFQEIRRISEGYPSLGICLGHQLVALAHGARTTKLKYGHRGGNHPVKELATGRVSITSQNHSYVVVEESIVDTPFVVTYSNVNDGSIEGLKHVGLPIHTVQFHPEAHPGPSDTGHILASFVQIFKH